jgi:flagellar basal body-associated protein FliL
MRPWAADDAQGVHMSKGLRIICLVVAAMMLFGTVFAIIAAMV